MTATRSPSRSVKREGAAPTIGAKTLDTPWPMGCRMTSRSRPGCRPVGITERKVPVAGVGMTTDRFPSLRSRFGDLFFLSIEPRAGQRGNGNLEEAPDDGHHHGLRREQTGDRQARRSP